MGEIRMTTAEGQFLNKLQKKFAKDGRFSSIEQKVLEAITQEFAKEGETTLERIQQINTHILAEHSGNKIAEKESALRAMVHDAWTSMDMSRAQFDDLMKNEYAPAAAELKVRVKAHKESEHEIDPEQQQKWAKKAGMTSGISKEEKAFLHEAADILSANMNFIFSNKELYLNLEKSLQERGQTSLQEIEGIIREGLQSNVRLSEESRVEAITGKPVEYDVKTPLLKAAEKAGISKSSPTV